MLCPGAQAPAPMLPIALMKEKNKMNGTLTVKCSGQSGLTSLLTPWGKGQACHPTGPRQVPQKGSAVSCGQHSGLGVGAARSQDMSKVPTPEAWGPSCLPDRVHPPEVTLHF